MRTREARPLPRPDPVAGAGAAAGADLAAGATPGAGAQLAAGPPLALSAVLRFWWPLAASWLLMSTETPIVTAFAARMGDAKLQLAAFGIAFSLALAVESPVIAMLTAGNALARDGASYHVVRRFMLALSAAVTAGMLLLSCTPLFSWVVLRLIGAPAELAAPVRSTLWAMTLWPAAVAYRRFHQGVMIRHGYTRRMSYGTAIRLCATLAVSAGGMLWGRLPGATAAGVALTCAVIAEAAYAHYASRAAERRVLAAAPGQAPCTLGELLRFYAPLAMTSTIMLSTTPILNYGMIRSPAPIASLAVWPVVNGQLFILRSFGYSLQEAIVALLNGPAAERTLRRFTAVLAVGSTLLLLGVAFTPVGPWWQRRIAGLSEELAAVAVPALRYAALLPLLAVIPSWLRGVIVTRRATGAVARATGANLLVLLAVLLAGARGGWLSGASLAAVALTASQAVECVWLWRAAHGWRQRAATLQARPEAG